MSKKTTDEELDNEPEEKAALEISFKPTDVDVEPLSETGRRKSGYNLFLGRCLVGSKIGPEKSLSKHMRECNLSWRSLSEEEKERYSKLAAKENE